MQIHLINLDRTPERLANFHKINAHLAEVVRFPAIDGRALDVAALIDAGTIEREAAATRYTRGAIGAALSHRALWARAIESGQPVTVAEDDAIFCRNFARAARALLDALPADWDFVLWGWNFDANLLIDLVPGASPCLCTFDQVGLSAGAGGFPALDMAAHPFVLLRAFGIPCYSVSARGAQILAATCFPIRTSDIYFPGLDRRFANIGIDVAMNDAYPGMKAYAALPPLVVTRNDRSASTIQEAG